MWAGNNRIPGCVQRMIAQRRDNNEKDIIDYARRENCAVIQMDKSAGFDLLIISPRTGTHIIEVKNPAVKWRLEPAEQKRKEQIESAGGMYHIIFYPSELGAII